MIDSLMQSCGGLIAVVSVIAVLSVIGWVSDEWERLHSLPNVQAMASADIQTTPKETTP